MKKTFSLTSEKKTPERHLEWTKNEIRKYIKREQKKKLPEGVDYYKFECKFGMRDETPKVIEFVDIIKNVDAASKAGCDTFYLEIISTNGVRGPRKPRPPREPRSE